MVFKKKRVDYRGNGFQVPIIPRGPRSSRRRTPNLTTGKDSQICAFELLASLAGQLLQESESSSASSNASEENNQPTFGKDVIKQVTQDKPSCFEQGSSEESGLASGISSPDIKRTVIQKNLNSALEQTSSISDYVYQVGENVRSKICSNEPAFQNYLSKVEAGDADLEKEFGAKTVERLESPGLTTVKTSVSNDPRKLQIDFPTILSEETDAKLSLRETVYNAYFSRHRSDIKLVGRDDDENIPRSCKSSTKVKASRPPTRTGDRRIRKLLTSKYWKSVPKLRDCEVFKPDGGRKTLFNKRKHGYFHDRYQHEILHKRRKLFERSRSILMSSDGGFSSESVTNSPEKGKRGNSNGSEHGATGVSSPVISRQSSFHSEDSHVKFSIKSFKIPEIYIEVPETATFGSLKRTVMDAVTAIIGGGLRVGVLLEGEKIRDDNITLLQTGISRKDNLDTLGFTLESNTLQASPSICCDGPYTPEPLTRSLGTPVLCSGISDPPLKLLHPVTNSDPNVDNNNEVVSSLTDSLTDTALGCRALVVIPPVSMEALAVIPAAPKSRKSSELVQRRIRRPFSISEVEALVQSVEELGTGRWRDVKLRSFEEADHRTYVDLKDKWKTLVHTATISPQQRRGEPVPQEVLDRVLAAHSYWSQHQARHHAKPATPLKLANSPADTQGCAEGIASSST